MAADYPPLSQLPVLFEDDTVLVVNKPGGMLSQPGKYEDGSVLTRVLESGRKLHGPVLVHRLDMDTSGLILLAKSRDAHRALQQQFENRQIRKRYRALLENPVTGIGGCVQLPIRLDVDNRPRQIVCEAHGKQSRTLWHKGNTSNAHAITLYPLTGRTHQLRVHAAAHQGLGNAIAGDRLYGKASCWAQNHTELEKEQGKNLKLHADFLQFTHPTSQESIAVNCPALFDF